MGSGASGAFKIGQSAILDNAGNAHLKRTPGTAGNRRTFTLSCWIKRTKETANASIFTQGLHVTFDPALLQVSYYTAAGGHLIRLGTTTVFRDTVAWYHIVLAFDTTQGTATDRVKIYINGVRQTSFVSGQQTFPSQNLETSVNNTADVFYLGSLNATANSIGYLAETHFIDGTAKAASDFGETNDDTGQWVPKEYEGGSYGTNGFYMKFASGAIGTDSSGEGNDLTAVNLANSDVVIDTPTNNFCTMNSLSKFTATTMSEGNLKLAESGHSDTTGTFRIPHTGKWYFECVATTAGGAQLGIAKTTYHVTAGQWGSEQRIINVVFSNGNAGYNAGGEVSYIGSAISNGNTVGVAIDSDNGKIYFAKNNTWGNSGNPLTGTNPAATFTASDDWQPLVYGNSGSVQTFNFGQKSFAYTPPSGFKTLCTKNLPDPAITLPGEHFNTVTYTGNGADDRNMTGVGFQPDFVWLKSRSGANNHYLYDAIRGPNKQLLSNATVSEGNIADRMQAFQSDGFQLGTSSEINNNGHNYVSWNWKAGGTAPVKTYVVKVVSDSGNKYRFDDYATSAQTVHLQEGGTYTFDQSHSSNSNHPFRFSTTSNGSHGGGSEYTTGVTTYGSPGSSGAYTRITVAASAATLYYYCTAHSGMGGQINTNSTFGSTNFKGNRTAIVSANIEAGFSASIHAHNNASSDTYGHGLGVAPDLIIEKKLDVAGGDGVVQFTAVDGSADYMRLNTTVAKADAWSGMNAPTSTVYSSSVGSGAGATSVITWAFATKPGYSKVGIYVGNGATDNGPFVNLGFRPAWLLIKNVLEAGNNWLIFDSARDRANEAGRYINANTYAAEADADRIDLLSNGFKVKHSYGADNTNGRTYLYLAFAESPFKYANAR